MDAVYVETTVIGNIAGRLHPDPHVAARQTVQYLVTWNFKHIANPTLQNKIASVRRDNGFEPPVICTPEQLLEAEHDSDSD
ncbi:MAG: hypothetical protein KY475_04105 [Planctomycetes bacterium]|nr:hypothetical protein [Planctomycetota bacterium]